MKQKIVCGLCACNCIGQYADGHIRGVKGSITGGFLCEKGAALADISDASDRIDSPYIRGSDGLLCKATMDEAIRTIACGMEQVRREDGASAYGIHSGQAGVRRYYPLLLRRLADLFGTENYATIGSTCNTSKRMAYTYMLGGWPQCNYGKAGVIVLWGHSASRSHPKDYDAICRAAAAGARIISVNPRRGVQGTGNLELTLRPGTDRALAWLMLKIVFDRGWYDRHGIQALYNGLPQVLESVKGVSAQTLSDICGVSLREAEEAVRLMWEHRPAAIMVGTAVELQQDGFQAVWAIVILQALLGLDALTFLKRSPLRLPSPASGSLVNKQCRIGEAEAPAYCGFTATADSNLFARAILAGKLTGLLICGGNPLGTWNQTGELRKALRALKHLVVMDTCWTQTARMAEVVIPAAGTGEKDDLIECVSQNGDVYLNASHPVLQTHGISEVTFCHQLACRLGLGEEIPWETPASFFDVLLHPLGFKFAALDESPNGLLFSHGEGGDRLCDRILTGTAKKLTLTIPALTQYGLSELPSPPENPEVLKPGEIFFSSCCRRRSLTATRFRDVERLASGQRPLLELNPVTAVRLGISDGQKVCLSRAGQSLILQVSCSEEVREDVGLCTHGWPEADPNLLSRTEELDPISGFPRFSGFRVNVEGVKE